MKLILKRIEYRDDGIVSKLMDEDTNLLMYCLEHSYDKKPKIPNGDYTCARGMHCLHGGKPFETFEVMGVKGHKGILFHVGNYNKDSEGCILVGKAIVYTADGVMVTKSKLAFAELLELLKASDTFQVNVVG